MEKKEKKNDLKLKHISDLGLLSHKVWMIKWLAFMRSLIDIFFVPGPKTDKRDCSMKKEHFHSCNLLNDLLCLWGYLKQ